MMNSINRSSKQANTMNSVHLAALLLSLATMSYLVQQAQADHALSEVWSEADGIQMKFSTDHDLASELSIKRDSQASPASSSQADSDPTDTSSGSESRPPVSSVNEPGSLESAEKQTTSASNEQEKHQHQSSQQLQDEAEAGEASPGEASVRGNEKSRNQDNSNVLSFGLASEKVGDALSDLEGALHEQANADIDEPSERQQQESAARFRSPGRLFQQALRMGGPSRVQHSQDQTSSVEQDSGSGAGPSEGQEAQEENSQQSPLSSAQPEEPAEMSDAFFGANQPQAERRSSGRKQSLEFGASSRLVSSKPSPEETSSSSSGDIPAPNGGDSSDSAQDNLDGAQGNEPEGKTQFDSDEQRDWPSSSGSELRSQQQTRSNGIKLAKQSASSQAESMNGLNMKQGVRKLTGSSAKNLLHSASSESNQNSGPGKRTYQAYFRGQQSLNANGVPTYKTNRAKEMRAPVDSPDGVRDNFISPGHFPGSMAHLTQAASETRQSEALGTGSKATAAAAQSVTPEPMDKSESQQIMAPVLISTTTPMPMAPKSPSASPSPK